MCLKYFFSKCSADIVLQILPYHWEITHEKSLKAVIVNFFKSTCLVSFQVISCQYKVLKIINNLQTQKSHTLHQREKRLLTKQSKMILKKRKIS